MKSPFPAVALLAFGIAHAQSYSFVMFDVPGAKSTSASGINNSGLIVGTFQDAGGITHGYVRSTDDVFTTFDPPGATPGRVTANGINNLGQVVGSFYTGNVFHGYIRSAAGEFTVFELTSPTPGAGPQADATGINDRGEVVGPASDVVFGNQGYRRNADGTFTVIRTSLFGGVSPTAINNGGAIAGWGLNGSSMGTQHGFLRTAEGVDSKVDLPGTTTYTRISALNNAGQFAGSMVSGLGFVSQPDGSFTLLPGYPVAGINDNGQIVGSRFSGEPLAGHAFIGTPAAAPPQPTIRTALPGVRSASAFGGAAAIAPGTWIEIYGQNLAPNTREWRTSDFNGSVAPTSLDGVSVSIDSTAAYVSYISPGQVNAFVPSTLAAGTARVTVVNGSLTSEPYEVQVNAFQPSMLTIPYDIFPNQTYLAALFPDFVTYVLPAARYPNVPARYAKSGDTIILFGMGFGAASPDVEVTFRRDATVAGRVTYAGPVAGTIGLYQINVVVPDVLSAGETSSDFVYVNVTVNGKSAQVNGPQGLGYMLPVAK